jgi:ribosomal protein S18 acetylase RimI-like enzyme
LDVINKMYKDDVYHKVAQLHCKHINNSFLATLGPSFLTLMYKAIDNDKSSVLIAKEVNGDIVGFVSGAVSLGTIYKRLLYKPFSLFLALMSCLYSVSKLFKIFEIIFLKKNNPILKELPQNELLTIVVDPSHQGQGYAEDLFESLCNHFKAINVLNFKIVVGSELARAHAFYLKMGCTIAGEVEVHKGKNSLVYVKQSSIDNKFSLK